MLKTLDKITDDWPLQRYGIFDNIEHARWSVVFDFLGTYFNYHQKHFGLTVDYGIKPTFNIGDLGWFHCCSGKALSKTKVSAQMVAERTGVGVTIAQGAMFQPDRIVGAMPLWYTTGEGVSHIRYLCCINRRACIRSTENINDCTCSRVQEAFRRGLALK